MSILRSETINDLVKALAAAQGSFTVPQKKRTATVQMRDGKGTYTYNYADLSDIREAVNPGLSKNGIALTQVIDADSVRLTTLLLHESGQFLGSTYDLPKGLPAQQFGSALTYARRYSLCSLLGVVAEDDDDVQSAQGMTERNARNKKTSPMTKPAGGVAIVPNATKGGTSGEKLPSAPIGTDRGDVNAKTRSLVNVFMKLGTNEDPSTMVMERYGAQKPADMTLDEAFDFMVYLENRIKQGVAV